MAPDATPSTRGFGIGRLLLPARIRRSFRAKLVVAFVLLVAVMAVIGGTMYLQTQDSLRQSTNEELERTATLQARTTAQWVDGLRDQAQLLSASRELSSTDTDQVWRFMTSELEEGDRLPAAVVALHYLDSDSYDIVTSTNPAFQGVNAREKGAPWAQRDLTFESPDDTVISKPFPAPGIEKPVFAVISPVAARDDRALVIMVSLEHRAQSISGTDDQVSSVVVDDEGTVVLAENTDRILGQNMGPADVKAVESMAVKRGLDGGTGAMVMDMHGERMAMGYAPVDGTDWVMMVHTPADHAFALVRSISMNLAVLLGAAFVGLGLIGVTLGRTTVRSIDRLTAKAEALGEGDLSIDLESDREDEIGRLFAAFDDMRNSLQETIEAAETAKEQAEQERQQTAAFVDHLEETATTYGRKMERTAEGDLTCRLEPDAESDALAEIARAFNRMVDELETTVARVAAFADDVADAGREATAGTDEVTDASESVSESVQEIYAGADEQHGALDEAAAEMSDLSSAVEEVAAAASQASTLADRTAETGETARETAADAVETMDEVKRESSESITAIEALQDRMAEIDDIVEFITGIAEETNILALNASIEAARAGEAGDGFAVVADEVKSLAEETKDAAEEIADLVDTLREQSAATAEEVRETGDEVAAATDQVENTVAALEEIVDDVEETRTAVGEISETTDQQADSTGEVVEVVDDVAAISEETTAEAETVAAAAEQQTAAVTEVAEHVSRLADRATRLDDLLSNFTVREGRSDGETGGDAGAGTVAPEASGDVSGMAADGGDAEGFGREPDDDRSA